MKDKIFELLPSLKNKAKKSIRVLPQEGRESAVNTTKIGGLFLWSDNEPWIYCDTPEVTLHKDYSWNDMNLDAFGHNSKNIWDVTHPKHNDAFISILQLRSEDFPIIEFPNNKNILQLLWCPRDHLNINSPLCEIIWKNETNVQNQVSKHPTPSHPEKFDLTPSPSKVLLKEVLEYPAFWELCETQRNLLSDKQRDFYFDLMSPKEGIKVGGHPSWIQDPEVPICACFNKMEHLLTIGSDIFEDYPNHKAPGLVLGDCGSIYVFICYNCKHLPI